MKNKMFISLGGILLLTAVLSACASGVGGGSTDTTTTSNPTNTTINNSDSTTLPEPTPTAVGLPIGTGVTQTIGTAGGSITSPDSRVKITIPPGALATNTDINIQPIVNLAHGGIGNAYRLTPDGQTFLKPVTMKVAYTNEELEGTAVEYTDVAFQTTDGYWQLVNDITVNAADKTATALITHFSDYSPVQFLRINPPRANLLVDSAISLQVEACYDSKPPENPHEQIAYKGITCSKIGAGNAPLWLSDWSVNQVPGGNDTVGRVSGNLEIVSYTAPHSVPKTNPVFVTVNANVSKIPMPPDANKALVSSINIVQEAVWLDVVAKYEDPLTTGLVSNIKDTVSLSIQVGFNKDGGAWATLLNVDNHQGTSTINFTKYCPRDSVILDYEYFTYNKTHRVTVDYFPAVELPPGMTLPPGTTVPSEKKDVTVVLYGWTDHPGTSYQDSGEGSVCNETVSYKPPYATANSVYMKFSILDLKESGQSITKDDRDSYGRGWKYTVIRVK